MSSACFVRAYDSTYFFHSQYKNHTKGRIYGSFTFRSRSGRNDPPGNRIPLAKSAGIWYTVLIQIPKGDFYGNPHLQRQDLSDGRRALYHRIRRHALLPHPAGILARPADEAEGMRLQHRGDLHLLEPPRKAGGRVRLLRHAGRGGLRGRGGVPGTEPHSAARSLHLLRMGIRRPAGLAPEIRRHGYPVQRPPVS